MDKEQSDAGFDRWWEDEGSGIAPKQDEEHCFHAERVARIAWDNGAYCAEQSRPDPVAAMEQEHKRILRQVIEAWTIRCDAHRGATEAAEARVAALEAEVARLKEQRANLEAERDAAFDALGDYEIDDEPTTHEAGEPGLLKHMVLSLVDQIREGNRRSTALLAGRDELELLIGAMYSATEIYPLTDEEDSRLNDVLQKLRDKAPAAEGGAE